MSDASEKIKAASGWLMLIGASAALAGSMAWLGAPGAMLLGPLLAGMAVAAGGYELKVSNKAFVLAQGIIGCMIANILPRSFSPNLTGDWPMLVAGALSIVVASGMLGWLLARLRLFPGSTGVWGFSPGAATVMTVLAEAHGADAQMVAVMQYARAVMAVSGASLVARLCGVDLGHHSPQVMWFTPVAWGHLAQILALVLASAALARWLRFRAGALLLPLFAGYALTQAGLMTLELPRWLLALAYAMVGWRIGLRFTRPLLLHVGKVLPRILVCSLALILLCAGLGLVLAMVAGIDPLTAYLAMSPGGADSMAIIAVSSNANASLVMAMQTMRALLVIFLGPAMARFVAKHTEIYM